MSAGALSLEHIVVSYHLKHDGIGTQRAAMRAVDDVSITVGPAECVGVVGESGSGKSTLANVAAGLTSPLSGVVKLGGRPLPGRVERRTPDDLRAIQIVFQDPNASLDPTMALWTIVTEGLAARAPTSRTVLRAKAASLLKEVGLDPAYLDRRPHELSGGQRQRIAIARALALEPRFLLLDEPTSALDVSVQAQILNLLLALQERRGLSYLFISHDLDVIRHMCHRLYVMRSGRVVEENDAASLFSNPREPYTRALIDAIPRVGDVT